MSIMLSRATEPSAITAFVYGHSAAIQNLNTIVWEVAGTNIPVLLMGESGTGKEVYGRLIHKLSKQCHTPLNKLSCRALEPTEFLVQLKSFLGGAGEGLTDGPRTLF